MPERNNSSRPGIGRTYSVRQLLLLSAVAALGGNAFSVRCFGHREAA